MEPATLPVPLWKLPAALLLGGLATLAHAPFDLYPLAPLTLAALFWLAHAHSPGRAFLLGWLFGLAHFASGIYWVYISTHIYGGAPAWLGALLGAALFSYMALYPALTLAGAAALRLFDRPAGWLGLPVLWLLTELLRGWVGSGFPWLSLGYSAVDLPLGRLAPLFGMHGISALLVAIAYGVFRVTRLHSMARARAALAVVALAASPLLLPPAPSWTQDSGAPLDSAIIQGNIAQDLKWKREMQRPTLDRFQEMTLAARDADLIVWPEVALTQPYAIVREGYLEPIGAAVREAGGGTVLTGILVGTGSATRGYYNSLVAFGAGSGRYDKRHLVPFGEYFPIPDFMRPLMDVLGTPYSDFLVGAVDQPLIEVRGVPVAASICFEDVFGSEFRIDARQAQLLVNVTNDAWFGRSPAAHQHLQIARMRALETGRVIVRAANTGVSAVIGPDGAVQARAGHFTTEILRAPAQPRSGVTPYARWGNVPLWAAAGLVLLVLLVRRHAAGARQTA